MICVNSVKECTGCMACMEDELKSYFYDDYDEDGFYQEDE